MAERWREQLAGANPGGLGTWIATAPLTRDEMKRAHTGLIVVAVLALMSGAVSIAVPVITSVTIAIFIGWLLLFGGVMSAVHAVSHRAPLRGLEAIVTLLVGLYVLVLPLSGTVTLTFVLAIWFFASGVVSLAATAQSRGTQERAMALFGAVLSVLLGILIAVELPSSAAWAIGLLVGINLIFWSVRALIGARLIKQRLQSES